MLFKNLNLHIMVFTKGLGQNRAGGQQGRKAGRKGSGLKAQVRQREQGTRQKAQVSLKVLIFKTFNLLEPWALCPEPFLFALLPFCLHSCLPSAVGCPPSLAGTKAGQYGHRSSVGIPASRFLVSLTSDETNSGSTR
jgi:hypothetical protein